MQTDEAKKKRKENNAIQGVLKDITFIKIRRSREKVDAPFGGVSIVFSEDFHQLQPICNMDDIFLSASPGASF